MSLLELLWAIWVNITESKVRVALTTLGIVVGSATIVAVMAIGMGGQASVDAQFKQMNVGTLSIMPSFGKDPTQKLTTKDLEAIRENVTGISVATISINSNATVAFGTDSGSAELVGATPEVVKINNITLAAGDFFTDDDNTNRAKVAVVGSQIVTLLFNGDNSTALNQQILVGGKRFKIVGVMNEAGDSGPGMSLDSSVIVPYKIAESQISGRRETPRISVLVTNYNDIDSVTSQLEELLQKNHPTAADSFTVRNAGSRILQAKNSAKTMTLLLLSVATVVLIVGGIGIMNVLFVSVRERTREIVILKAIGARRKDILSLFLIEAFIISTLGGIVGVGIGLASIPVLTMFGVTTASSFGSAVLALVFSMLTGTFFGYYPAARASLLKPIDALNYE